MRATTIKTIILCASLVTGTASAAPIYDYKVIGQMAQSRDNFVQGLQIVDGHLYVSTGQYGKSRLLRYRMTDGTLETEKKLDNRLFGEGLTVLDDKVYQLTWRSRIALVYNKADLEGLEWFRLGGEGWGMTNDGKQLIYSDGSDQLHFLSPETLLPSHSITVTENGKRVDRLNELEWVEGEIWANIWTSNKIVMINPQDGTVTGSIDLRGLLPHNERRPGTDVLNGIALDPVDGSIWVTGKYWPWLYQIEIQRPPPNQHPHESQP